MANGEITFLTCHLLVDEYKIVRDNVLLVRASVSRIFIEEGDDALSGSQVETGEDGAYRKNRARL